MSENVFLDDWRECLRAHYMHVVRNNDFVTLPSLTVVMKNSGFGDSELAELRVRATMHVDDVGADHVPDLHILDTQAEEPTVFAGVDVTAEVPEVPAEALAETIEGEGEIEPEREAEPEEIPPPVDPDLPQQLSLF